MFQCITGIAFGVHDDQVGLQLGQSFGQKHIGGQGGHQLVARFEQANAQEARALLNGLRLFIPFGHQGGV